MLRTLCLLVAALTVLGPPAAEAMHAGKSHRYAVILIDQLPGDEENGATAVNAAGTVVGWSGVHVPDASLGTGFRFTPTTLDAPEEGEAQPFT